MYYLHYYDIHLDQLAETYFSYHHEQILPHLLIVDLLIPLKYKTY